jgi:integrase
MRLTDRAIRAAKPKETPCKLFDGAGLYLLMPAKAKAQQRPAWRFKYRYQNREKLISLGTYPDVSLKQARIAHEDARRLLRAGVDPSVKRQAERVVEIDTFEAIAHEFLNRQQNLLGEDTRAIYLDRLDRFVIPYIGKQSIDAIAAPDVLKVLRRIESRGTHETAHRVRSLCGRVFRYAVATGRAERDPTTDLKGALAPAGNENFPAITDPRRIGELLNAIDGYVGQATVLAALKLAPLLFVRPGELRAAQWAEFDLDGAEWRIPGARMKGSEDHIVPLSRQAIEILNELQLLTGDGTYLFPSLRTNSRPISDGTLNAALRRLGYSAEEMVAHGFRTMASTCLHELGWHSDVIEAQLAHRVPGVRGVYNRSTRIAERRKMMQAWADYLDGLKAGGKVVAIKAGARK